MSDNINFRKCMELRNEDIKKTKEYGALKGLGISKFDKLNLCEYLTSPKSKKIYRQNKLDGYYKDITVENCATIPMTHIKDSELYKENKIIGKSKLSHKKLCDSLFSDSNQISPLMNKDDCMKFRNSDIIEHLTKMNFNRRISRRTKEEKCNLLLDKYSTRMSAILNFLSYENQTLFYKIYIKLKNFLFEKYGYTLPETYKLVYKDLFSKTNNEFYNSLNNNEINLLKNIKNMYHDLIYQH